MRELSRAAWRPRGYCLVITHNFARNECSHSQPADAGGSIKPGVERSGTPGTIRIYRTSPRSGRQLLAQRRWWWNGAWQKAAARSAGL